jgi:excisionase family DNA binding protein
VTNRPEDPIGERKWLTLGLARTLLGINEATLRQWADNGLVRAFRTPGGHRRFSTEDIYSLMEGDQGGPDGVHVADPSVLPRLRRMVKGETHANVPAWMQRFDDEGHKRMRLLGREFLELCIEYIEQPDRPESLEHAAVLGATYGSEIASRGIVLSDALEAFFFFRNATIGAIKPTLNKRGATADEAYAMIDQLTKLTDQVLLSLTSRYNQAPLTHEAPNTKPAKPKQSSRKAGAR